MKKLILFFLVLLPCHGLFAQQYEGLPDTVWVAVTAHHEHIHPEMADMFLTSAEAAFYKANQHRKQNLKFMLTHDSAYADVHFQLMAYRVPTGSEKTSALLLTIVGVGAPILLAASGVALPVAFYFTPQNRYLTSVHFSENLKALGFVDQGEVIRKVGTGYAASDRRNEGKIAADFGNWMHFMGRKWNKKQQRALKRAARI